MKYLLCVIAGALLGAGGVFVGMYEPPPPPDPKPVRDPDLVATVGDLQVYVADVEAELARRRSGDVDVVLQEILERLAVVAKAGASGLHKEYSVNRKLGNVLIGELRERELDPLLESVAVSEEAVNGYYRSHREKYSKGRKIRLAMLTKEYSERWSEAKRGAVLEGLEGLRMRALEEPVTGKGFGALAIEGTEFQAARYKGGDVGWFSEGLRSRWPEAVVTLGFALKKAGDVSELVEADGRLFVLKLMDERASGVTPFEEVRKGLKHSLTIQAKKDAEREWWKAARAAANVEIFDDALGRVEVPENVRPKPTQVPPGLP